MATRAVIEYRDFTGGDWGRRQPWNAPKNSFKANNMLVYRTGELGVRPGLKNITPTGLTTGKVIALSETPRTFNDALITFVQGSNLRYFQATSNGGGVNTYAGTFAGTPSLFNYFNGGREVYFAVGTQGVYKATAFTLSLLNNLGGTGIAEGIALFGDRLVINDQGPARNNLRYNGLTAGVSDFTSWPTTNVIPVGDNSELTSIDAQRTHLTIGKERQGIYVLTGQLSVSENLRQVTTNKGPILGALSDITRTSNKGIVWYVDAYLLSPFSFDGTDYAEYKDIVLPLANSDSIAQSLYGIGPFNLTDDDGVVFLTAGHGNPANTTPSKALVHYNGVWTQHTFNSPTDIFTESWIQGVHGTGLLDPSVNQSDNEALATQIAAMDTFVMCKITGNSETPVFYGWSIGLDRPGYRHATNSTYNAEDAGDDSAQQVTADVAFPEFHDPKGQEFMVKEVIVDFRSWNTNGSLNNHFDLQVDCLRPYDNSSPITSLKGSWDQPGSLSSTAGTIRRETFMFGDQGYGNGMQLKFTNVRGIAFQRIQVVLSRSTGVEF